MQALAIVLCTLLFTQACFAQPVPAKTPDSVHLFPAGAQRGSTVAVHVGLEQSPPNTNFYIRGDGVSGDSVLSREVFDDGQPSPRRIPTEIPINYPRQWAAEISISPDAPLGAASWDTFCASGGSSGSLPFIIGDLPEFIEQEPNSTLAKAHPTMLPITVNGQIHGERDLDYYLVELQSGQVIYGEVLARRLGSKLEPTIAIFDASGKPQIFQEDSIGDDPLFAFKASEAGAYTIQLGNVSFHGSPSHVYRMNLTYDPVAPYVFPIGAPAGQPTKFRFLAMDGAGGQLEIERELTLNGVPGAYKSVDVEGLSNRPPLRILPPNAQVITTLTHRQKPEVDIITGQTANGVLAPFSSDTFNLVVEDKTPIDLRVHAPAQTSATSLVIVTIRNSEGKTLVKTKLNPTSHSVKAYHHMANPAPGNYSIEVQSLGGVKSDHRLGSYQLELSSSNPDFSLTAARDCVTVIQGQSIEIPITLNRHGGFRGEVTLSITGIPEGVVIENNLIGEDEQGTKLKLTLPADEPSTRHEIQISGEATINGQVISRGLLAMHRGVDSFQQAVESPYREFIAMAVAHKPVFRLYCEEAYQYAHRGTIYPYQMTLERLDNFQAPVTIQTCDRQNRDMDGIQFLTTVIEPGSSVFMMPIYLPETMHINIQSQSQLYTQAYATFVDSHGTEQHVMVVSEKRNMIRTMPTVTKLYNQSGKLHGLPGEKQILKLDMQRTSNMLNSMTVTASSDNPIVAELFRGLEFNQGQRKLEFPFTLPDNLPAGKYSVVLEATGPLDSKPDHTVVTSVEVEFEIDK